MIRKFMFLSLLMSISHVSLAENKIVKNISDTKEIDCLAKNIYYEAKNEPEEGMVAVGVVTLNRVHHKSFPDSICSVVYHKIRKICQFSWTCNKIKRPEINDPLWEKSILIAKELVSNNGFAQWRKKYGKCIYFHATYINPGWKMARIAKTGKHIFYAYS